MYVIYAPNLGTKQVSSGAERDYIRTKAPQDKNSPPGQKVPRTKAPREEKKSPDIRFPGKHRDPDKTSPNSCQFGPGELLSGELFVIGELLPSTDERPIASLSI